jgi:hypothetical protein
MRLKSPQPVVAEHGLRFGIGDHRGRPCPLKRRAPIDAVEAHHPDRPGTPGVQSRSQDLPTPARRRLRCQSRASSSSACFGVFCPSKASDIALRSEISSASHTGCAGVGNPVSIASAATGGQPSFRDHCGITQHRAAQRRVAALRGAQHPLLAARHASELQRPVRVPRVLRNRKEMAVDPSPALRLTGIARHGRPGPVAGGLRQLRIVDERAVGREGSA